MKKCSFCGAENEDAAAFCEECGKSFYKKCDKCGADNKITAKFCNKCGARFIASNTICYTATEKIESTWIDENSLSHDFEDGNGYIVLKNAVNIIDGEIFKNCKGLTSITIPDSVTEITIPYWTIGEYKKLLPSNVWDKLKEIPEPNTIYYEADKKIENERKWDSFWKKWEYYDWIDNNSISHEFANGKGKIRLKDDVTEIGYDAFAYCSGLTSVSIPNTVTSIGKSAFRYCEGLTTINIPDSVTEIGWCAFNGCNSLTEINIPDSVTEIGEYAFCDCNNLISVNIGNSVIKIGWCAFLSCAKLKLLGVPITTSNIIIPFGTTNEYKELLPDNAVDKLKEYIEPHTIYYKANRKIETEWITKNSISNEYANGKGKIKLKKDVTEIGYWAFRDYSGFMSITLPNSVTKIGESAFGDCRGLSSINIPDSVTEISKSAFSGCSGLAEVTIGNSVTSINEYAFYGCSGLNSINIPESVTEIGRNSFSGCIRLSIIHVSDNNKVYDSRESCNAVIETASNKLIIGCMNTIIPTSVMTIGESAFYGCSSLTSINIPDSVKRIGEYAFDGCKSLTSIKIPDSVIEIGDSAFYHVRNIIYCGPATGTPLWGALAVNGYVDGCLIYSDEAKTNLKGCSTSATEVSIPNSVTEIGESAFYGCSRLTQITIGESVTCIGYGAFHQCINLKTVYFNAIKCWKIGYLDDPEYGGYYSPFVGCPSLEKIVIGEKVTVIPESTFYNTEWYNNQPDDILYLNNWCLGYKGEKTTGKLTIKEGTIGFANNAFKNCGGLTSVTIPDSVREINESAFEDCWNLTSVTIGNSVAKIGKRAFWNCERLTSIVIPDSVNEIDENAFERCWDLTSVTIGNSVTKIGKYAFNNCERLTSIVIPDSVNEIDEKAFMECYNLTSVKIGNSVTKIGESAFNNCRNLTSIVIPDSVTEIGGYAFSRCSRLTAIVIPDSVKEIGEGAFDYCDSLEEIIVHKGTRAYFEKMLDNELWDIIVEK